MTKSNATTTINATLATTLTLKVYRCENSEARTLEVLDSNGKIVAVDKVENDNELYDSKLLELDLESIEFYNEDGVLTCVCEDSCEENETDNNEEVATINASTVTATKLKLIRHEANTTFKWYNMTVKYGNYYGYLTVGNSTTPVFWSGWVSASAIYLYDAITCMADWVDECDLDDPRIYIVGGEPYVEDYDNAISEWESDNCYGYRPNEGDYLPFWIYNIYDGWNPLYM